MKALGQQDTVLKSRAAAVLTSMIDENTATKERLLQIPLGLGTGPQQRLLQECVQMLGEAVKSSGEILGHEVCKRKPSITQ